MSQFNEAPIQTKEELLDNCRQSVWNDIQKFSSSLSPLEQTHLKIFFFSQGLTHAQRRQVKVNPFGDAYLRNPQASNEDNITNIALTQLNIDDNAESYYIPLISKSAGEGFIERYRDILSLRTDLKISIIEKIIGEGSLQRTIPCLMITGSDLTIEDFISLCGQSGIIANKDQLLWIIAVHFDKYTIAELMGFDKNTTQGKPNITSYQGKDNIFIRIQNILNAEIPDTFIEPGVNRGAYTFYWQLLGKLFAPLSKDLNILDTMETSLKTFALNSFNRLFDVLFFAYNSTTYADFILGVELAMDEFSYLLHFFKSYTLKDIYKIVNGFWQHELSISENIPQHYALTGSGMGALRLALDAVINNAESSMPLNISLRPELYFEFLNIIKEPQTILKEESIVTLTADGIKDTRPLDPNEVVDLICTAFADNVDLNPGFHGANVDAQIAAQLALRAKLNTDKQLIVIIDYTMNNFSDPRLQDLTKKYANEIKDGKLAILVSHSLNKHAMLGLDRSFAGTLAAFYNRDKFPGLESLENTLEGYRINDPTINFLTYLCQESPQLFDQYFTTIQNITREAYEHIPKALYESNQNLPITIDPPKNEQDPNHMWSFLVIRMNHRNLDVLKILCAFIINLNIQGRDGYGFAESTVSGINNAIRINIGLNTDMQKVQLIGELLTELNAEIKDPENPSVGMIERYCKQYIKKWYQICIERGVKVENPNDIDNDNDSGASGFNI